MKMFLYMLEFWSYAWVLSVILLSLRDDNKGIFIEIMAMLLLPSFFTFMVSVVLIYVILPFTIPYSIAKILKNQ